MYIFVPVYALDHKIPNNFALECFTLMVYKLMNRFIARQIS